MTSGLRRALSGAAVAGLLLGGTVHCTEDRYHTSLRGEWRFHSPDTGASGTVELPADLTAAAGLANRSGQVILERELPAEINALLEQGVPVSFNAGSISDVFAIELNGVPAGGRGSIEPYEPGYFRTFVADLPGTAVRPAQAEQAAGAKTEANTIAIRIFTNGKYPIYVYGPALSIGESKAVYAQYYRGEAFIFMLLAMYAFIAFYHLLLAVRRPAELHNLYFGLFTLVTAAYWFFGTELRGVVFGGSVLTPMMLEHVLLYNLGPLLLLFLSQLFYKRHSRVALVLVGLMLLFSAVSLLAPFAIKRLVLQAWQGSVLFLIPYVVWYVVRAYRERRPDAGFLVLSVAFFMCAAVHDILVLVRADAVFAAIAKLLPFLPEYQPSGPIASYAFLLVIFGVAAMLANRFARVHTEAERLNIELEDRVQARTAELREAQRETDDILATVQEGLFLLYRSGAAAASSFPIGQQHSKQLSEILAVESQSLPGRDFLELLESMLRSTVQQMAPNAADSSPPPDVDDVLAGTRKYLELMCAGKLPVKTLNKLNPLAEIRLRLTPEIERDLQFRFYRLKDSPTEAAPVSGTVADTRRQLMAVVVDVTSQKELARRLLAEQEKSEAERVRLFAVLRSDPRELAGFISDSTAELELARTALAQGDRDGLFRAVHAMKGDAGMLELAFFADRAHDCEAHVERWLARDSSGKSGDSGEAEIARRLDGLAALLDAVRGDLDRMQSFQENYSSEHGSSAALMVRGLERLCLRASERQAKQVTLDASELLAAGSLWERLPAAVQAAARDALIQLVRNSVVHGIEAPEQREAAGKPPAGTVQLSLYAAANGEAILALKDDGRGLDLAGLTAKARSTGRWTDAEIDSWDEQTVAALIYQPGLSTAASADGDAGRGVGMDLVRERVRGVGGRLDLRFRSGEGAEFRLRFGLS